MKLYNRTTIPTEVLEAIIVQAGRNVGARTSGVVAKVTRGRSYCVSGVAKKCTHIRHWFLMGKSCPKSPEAQRTARWGRTDGGYFTMTVGRIEATAGLYHGTKLAEEVYETALHEWAHIADYQSPLYGTPALAWSKPGASGRRCAWKRRPEEIRAQDAVYKAKEKARKRLVKKPEAALLQLAHFFAGEGQ